MLSDLYTSFFLAANKPPHTLVAYNSNFAKIFNWVFVCWSPYVHLGSALSRCIAQGLESAGTSGTPFPCEIFHLGCFLPCWSQGLWCGRGWKLQHCLRPSSEVTWVYFHCVLLVKATDKFSSDTKSKEMDSFSRREHPMNTAEGCRPRGCESWRESQASL